MVGGGREDVGTNCVTQTQWTQLCIPDDHNRTGFVDNRLDYNRISSVPGDYL